MQGGRKAKVKEKKVKKDTWHIDGVSGGGRIAAVTLAFAALALLFFIACSAIDLPIPVMQPKLENPSVDPGSGLWNQSFNYTVNCNFSNRVNITLEVYNLSVHDWENVGDKTYNNTGEWEELRWENVKICSGKCEGTSSYRFKYNETILLTKSGPTIIITPPPITILKEFKNATVKPASGHYNDSFNYSVYVNLNKTINNKTIDITLEVFDISSYKWKAVGNKNYTNPGDWQKLTFTWNGKNNIFDKDCAGLASYRFYYTVDGERHESDLFYGPELESWYVPPGPPGPPGPRGGGRGGGGGSLRGLLMRLRSDEEGRKELAALLSKYILPEGILPGGEEIKPPKLIGAANVMPDKGSWHESFDYSIVVEHPSRVDMRLTLEVYSPGKNKTLTIGTREIKPWMYDEATNRTTVEWPDVNIFSKEDVKVDDFPKYYIRYNDGKKKGIWGFSGPELTNSPPVLTNSTVSPEEGRYEMPFEYKVNITDEDGDDMHVTLYILDPDGKEIYNETHPVKGIEAKAGKIESWIYNEFTEEASNKTFKYYFNATDGIDFNVTEKYNGPYIKFVPPVKLIMPYEPYPNSSNWHDEFTYKARIYNPTTEEVIVSLEVYIPSEGEWKKKYDEAIEPDTERDLIWSVRPFSVKDFNMVSKYRFTVKGGPLTYGKEEEFYGPAITDVLIPVL